MPQPPNGAAATRRCGLIMAIRLACIGVASRHAIDVEGVRLHAPLAKAAHPPNLPTMNPVEIEEAVSNLAREPFDRAEFPFQFLAAFDNPDTTIRRLRSGQTNQSDIPGGVLQRNNIHIATCGLGEVDATLKALRESPKTASAKAKFILATDGETFQAEDLNGGGTVACAYSEFPDHFGFFLPLAGITTVKEIRESSFDVKATGRLNRLYVQLLKENPDWATAERQHDMNHFASLELSEAGPIVLPLDTAVHEWMHLWNADMHERASQHEGIVAGWFGKMPGVALRLSLVLQHLWWASEKGADKAPPSSVSSAAYEAATTLIDSYAAPMALRTMNASQLPEDEQDARVLLRLLIARRTERFNLREVRRGSLGALGALASGRRLEAACRLLSDACLVRHLGGRAGTTAGRPRSDFEVNPLVR